MLCVINIVLNIKVFRITFVSTIIKIFKQGAAHIKRYQHFGDFGLPPTLTISYVIIP